MVYNLQSQWCRVCVCADRSPITGLTPEGWWMIQHLQQLCHILQILTDPCLQFKKLRIQLGQHFDNEGKPLCSQRIQPFITEEELKRLHAAGYGQVGFNYDAPAEPSPSSQTTEVDEPFEPTDVFKALLPADIILVIKHYN